MALHPKDDEAIKQLEWAIWFSQVDLDALREGDWINLEKDLSWFMFKSNSPSEKGLLGRTSRRTLIWPRPHASRLRNPTREEIRGLQSVLSTDVKKLAFYPLGPGVAIARPIANVSLSVEIRSPTVTSFRYAYDDIEGVKEGFQVTTASTFRLAFFEYLVRSGILGSQLRYCPKCRRIFLLKRKPRSDKEFYCSLRCSRLAATHAYRKRKAEELKAKERERSHRRHVTRQQKRFPGKRVKVQRRPRTSDQA
jgi:hypothetical protein